MKLMSKFGWFFDTKLSFRKRAFKSQAENNHHLMHILDMVKNIEKTVEELKKRP